MDRVRDIAMASLFVVVCGACQEGTVDIERAREDLLEVDRAFAAHSESDGYIEAYYRYSAPDVLLLPPGAPHREGREDIYRSDLEEGLLGQLTWAPTDGRVALSGDMGWTWGEWAFAVEAEGGIQQESRGKYLFVWQKLDGEWRMAVNMWNDNPEA